MECRHVLDVVGEKAKAAMVDKDKLRKIFRPILDIIMNSVGLNKNFPLDLVHAGRDYGGLEIDNVFFYKGQHNFNCS